nr:fibropellin-1-like [Parasteatoda tepidariorum]
MCVVGRTGAQCMCRPPYEGTYCERDPCAGLPCRNGGMCVVGRNGAQCVCHYPYEGKYCEIRKLPMETRDRGMPKIK